MGYPTIQEKLARARWRSVRLPRCDHFLADSASLYIWSDVDGRWTTPRNRWPLELAVCSRTRACASFAAGCEFGNSEIKGPILWSAKPSLFPDQGIRLSGQRVTLIKGGPLYFKSSRRQTQA